MQEVTDSSSVSPTIPFELNREWSCFESGGIYKFRVLPHGEMSEWFKVPVLKTGEAQASGGSNPSLSATLLTAGISRRFFLFKEG